MTAGEATAADPSERHAPGPAAPPPTGRALRRLRAEATPIREGNE